MDIKRAKQEIEHAVKAYLAVDDTGTPLIPPIRQRPILLMGPPGVGKTQIMEQIAQECGIALVAYTITHHTRQSAVGLPFIRHRNFGGADRSVTEYTMSEIIASVYDKMEQTGLEHGILFIDEINCVSETLAPTMLQFLQCKTFGNQAVPAGWVIVAAGNPPEYNKSVRDFDLVTLDRVRRIDIEPNLAVWQEYARAHRLHPAVQAYLELRPQHFYRIQNDVDGPQFVTARGWEDLSAMLTACTKLDLPVDEALIGQYLRHPEVARDFAAYWELYKKYRQDYGVEDILQGRPFAAVLERAQKAAFDERISLVSLLLAGLNTRFAAARNIGAVTDACYQQLRSFKRALNQQPEAGPAALFTEQCESYRQRLEEAKAAASLLPEELAARIRSLGRRSGKWEDDNLLTICDISYDCNARLLSGSTGSIRLSGREGRLLEVLLRSFELVIRREVLLSRVWGVDAEVEDCNLDTYIHYLRKRLSYVGSTLALKTIRGVGYTLASS